MDWQWRYSNGKGDWPHPRSDAGRNMSCDDFYRKERKMRAKNIVTALWFAKGYLPSAVRRETGEALDEVLSAILPSILMALAVVAGSTLVGITAGALTGGLLGAGIGAVPGAIAGGNLGFSAGMWILEWMGLAFLAVHVGKNMHEVTWMLKRAFDTAWGFEARDRFGLSSSDKMSQFNMPGFSQVTQSAQMFAQAVAILIRLVLEGIVLYITARGVAQVPQLVAQLRTSRLGAGFASWVGKNHQRLMSNPKLSRRATGTGMVPEKPAPTLTDHRTMQALPRQVKSINLIKADNKVDAIKSIKNLPNALQEKAKGFFQKASNKYTDFIVEQKSAGDYSLSMTKPGDVPGSKAIYCKEISPDGETLKVYKQSFDPYGNLIHTKNKL